MGLQHGGQRASPGAPRGRARTRAAGAMEPLLQRNGTPCLEQLLQSRCPEPAVRDLDFVEVFAGDAAVSVGLRAFGYRGISMDVRRDPTHDVLTRTGFIALLEFVLRLRPGGLLWAAPPCSTWVAASTHSTGRHLDPWGHPHSFYVQSESALVLRVLLLSALARSRGVVFTWEQPHTSSMLRWAPVKAFAAAAADLYEYHLEMGAYGLRAVKPTVLWTTAPFVSGLTSRMTPEARRCLRLRPDRLQTSIRVEGPDGTVRWQGTKDLKETQAYPMEFGLAHAELFDHWTLTTGGQVRAIDSEVLGVLARHAWFLQDLLDPSFEWHVNTARENAKRGSKSLRAEV